MSILQTQLLCLNSNKSIANDGLAEGVVTGRALVPVLLSGSAVPLDYHQITLGEGHLALAVSRVRVDLRDWVIKNCGQSMVLIVRLITKLGSDLELCII